VSTHRPRWRKAGIDEGFCVQDVSVVRLNRLPRPRAFDLGRSRSLRRLQRKLARQQKGSKRRAKTRTAIAKLKAKEADRRRDFIEQTTTSLVRDFDLIAVEDLAIKNMVRSAQGWSRLRRRLLDKAATCEVTVVAVNPAHTSWLCASCGHTCAENRKNQAVFGCRACGHEANADVNAAVNILAAGLAVTARERDIPAGTR